MKRDVGALRIEVFLSDVGFVSEEVDVCVYSWLR